MKKPTTIRISLPGPTRKFVEERCSAGGYHSIDEYIAKLIQDAWAQHEKGGSTECSDEYWAKKRENLLAKLMRHRRRRSNPNNAAFN